MKIQIAHKTTQPASHHSNIHIIERVKVVLEYLQTPKTKGDSPKSETTGYYIYERSVQSWTIVEEERWLSSLEINDMLSKHMETGELPDDIPSAIDALILYTKGISRADRNKRLTIAQEWADLYTKSCGEKKLFNQIN